jgi:hypothetical protein
MPSNVLRYQAEEFLRLARKAHDEGRLDDARALTLKAGEHLEDGTHPVKTTAR